MRPLILLLLALAGCPPPVLDKAGDDSAEDTADTADDTGGDSGTGAGFSG